MNLLSAKYDALSTEIRESPRGTREVPERAQRREYLDGRIGIMRNKPNLRCFIVYHSENYFATPLIGCQRKMSKA